MLPELQKSLLREQLDKHVTFANTLSGQDKIELQDLELEALAFDAALQVRTNYFANRREKVLLEYRKVNGLGDMFVKDGSMDDILPSEYIAVYMSRYPDTALDGKELEAAALVELASDFDVIDTDINALSTGNGDKKYSVEQANMVAFHNTQRGIKDKLQNLKRAVITANWK